MQNSIREILEEGATLRQTVASTMTEDIQRATELCIGCLKSGGKILIMGNGGSAADAQHIAGELVGRFLKERRALPAIALSTDTSILTALGNDYGYDKIFERQVEALGQKGDIALGISTSGNSVNVVKALQLAKARGMKIVGLLGCGGGKIQELCDVALTIPSNKTPRVQELHIAVGHIMCEEIEKSFYEE